MRSIRPCAKIALTALFGVSGISSGSALADGWTFTPAISGQELFTDNVLLTPTNRRADFVTTISPGFLITEDSARLQGTLNYSPSIYYYALTPGQNAIGHNLYGNGTATVIPDFAFFDMRAFATMQPSTPGLSNSPFAPNPLSSGANSTLNNPSAAIAANQLSQDLSFSASPYLARRFGDYGAGELRYTFSDTQISAPKSAGVAPPGFSAQSSSDRTNEATASFNTGERFGPYEGRLLLDAAKSTGSGVLNQASSRVVTLDSAYALTSRIAPLLTIGYENLQFSGFPPTRVNDLIWGVGVRLKPSPDAVLTLRYGHANGITAPNIEVVYNVTARIAVSVAYNESLSTITQQIANNLAVSLLDQDHQPINSRTLLPLSIVNPILGIQSGLFRSKQFNATATANWARDHFTVSLFDSKNAIVAQTTPGLGISQESLGANANWSHDFTINLSGNIGVGYSRFTFPTLVNSSENLFSASTSINYTLNSSLTGSVGYSFLDRSSPNPQLRVMSNVIYASLRKEF